MSFLDLIGLEHPVVQAGMGGGLATGGLAGEVSAAGGLGTVGTLPPGRLKHELQHARERAGEAPVAANLLIPFTRRDHVEACIEGGARVVVLHAGRSRAIVERLREGGVFVLQTVGTAAQARRALADGVDGLVAQGIEAGGHLVGVEPALDALARVRGVAGETPVLLAGGIADHADVRRALDAGADAAVAGTRFLLTEECAAHPAYKRRVLEAQRTIETRLFGLGWPMRHRVVPNAATERWCRDDPLGPRAIIALERLSAPLARLPGAVTSALHGAQRPWTPFYGPALVLAGMPERLVEVSPLYAGETALRIDGIVPAAQAVRRLAGVDAASPTIQP